MKTILIATDFSKIAGNAITYGAEIALAIEAKIVLFHAYHVPPSTFEIPELIPSLEQVEKNTLDHLNKIKLDLVDKYQGRLTIECVSKCGFAVDEINSYVQDHKLDMIVAGMQGTGNLAEKLIGNVATSLLRHSKCPVLAIDKKVKFKSLKKIVLACDYKDLDNESVLAPLKDLVRLFDSHLYVLHVVNEEVAEPVSEVLSGFMQIQYPLKEVEHSFHTIENESIVDGIHSFVSDEKMDMVVMIPHKHSLLHSLFHLSDTKRMAFHSDVPLLALH